MTGMEDIKRDQERALASNFSCCRGASLGEHSALLGADVCVLGRGRGQSCTVERLLLGNDRTFGT
jgi:hypothetical protein